MFSVALSVASHTVRSANSRVAYRPCLVPVVVNDYHFSTLLQSGVRTFLPEKNRGNHLADYKRARSPYPIPNPLSSPLFSAILANMKHARLFFTAILVPLDFLMLLLAAFLTYLIRYQFLRNFRAVLTEIPFTNFIDVVMPAAFIWIILFAANGMYTTRRLRVTQELGKVFFGCATGFVAIMIYFVFSQALFSSRFVLLASFLLAIFFVSLGRLIVRGLERLTLKHGLGTTRLVLIGNAASRAVLKDGFSNQPSLGYRVAQEFDTLNQETVRAIQALATKKSIEGLVLTDPGVAEDTSLETMNLAEDLHLRFIYSADLFAAASSNIETHTFAGAPFIEIKKTRLEGWGRIWKRLFDIFGSLILIIVTLPITVPAALAVLMETGRPIFFKNERVGEHGEHFNTLKFRSMHQQYSIGQQFKNQDEALAYEKQLIKERSEKRGPVYKIKDDPRLTGTGRFLRRWSADELPQFWNVLRGDMSLVGPRPHQPREVSQYERHHRHVLHVKPGITGLAQISGRADLDFEDEVRLDTYYIENWSLALDIVILVKTPIAVLMRRGAY